MFQKLKLASLRFVEELIEVYGFSFFHREKEYKKRIILH